MRDRSVAHLFRAIFELQELTAVFEKKVKAQILRNDLSRSKRVNKLLQGRKHGFNNSSTYLEASVDAIYKMVQEI